jgi:hypothetical protein
MGPATVVFELGYDAAVELFLRGLGGCGRSGAHHPDCLPENRQIREFDGFLNTLEHWLDEITNYFLERHTSGFVEGFNNRIKVLKRRCYGIFDVKRLFQRLTLDVNGYERFATT